MSESNNFFKYKLLLPPGEKNPFRDIAFTPLSGLFYVSGSPVHHTTLEAAMVARDDRELYWFQHRRAKRTQRERAKDEVAA